MALVSELAGFSRARTAEGYIPCVNKVGRYPIMGQIGSGGMGLVLASKHPEFGYEVAIKVLNSPDANAVQRERLRREAALLMRLRHPSLVEVIEWGDIDGAPWVAMRRVAGPSLGDQLRNQGPLPISEVYRLGLELTSALEVAHQGGVLHRDVKPENVISSDPFVLIDFGLAKELSPEHSSALTRTGSLQGSPGFLAPEQAMGKGRHATPATDVYGVGATLYAALLARAPIEAESMMEVLIATCERAPQPPSELRPEVDPSLEGIVLRCLAKDPADRFASIQALREALERASRSDGRPRRALSLATISGLVVSLLGLAVGAALALAASRPGAEAPREAAASPSEEPGQPQVADTPQALSSPRLVVTPEVAPTPQVAAASEPSPAETLEPKDAEFVQRAAALVEQGLYLEAQRVLEQGVAQDDAEACFDLSVGLRSWPGIKRDGIRAKELWDKAASLGSERAILAFVSPLRRQGQEAEALRFRAHATKRLQARIDAGDSDAMYTLATHQLHTKLGSEETIRFMKEKDVLVRRAAELGNLRAMTSLSTLLTPEGRSWRKRAAKLGSPQAMHGEGMALLKAGRKEEGLRLARAGAEQRVQHASETGRVYQDGLYGVEVDLAEAARFYRLAARNPTPHKLSQLGAVLVEAGGESLAEGLRILEAVPHRKGWTPTRLALADGYWKRSAAGDALRSRELLESEANTPRGLCAIALARRKGTHGFQKDGAAAWDAWAEAAKRFRDREANCMLGEELILGEIVTKDPAAALERFRAALVYPPKHPTRKDLDLLRRATLGARKLRARTPPKYSPPVGVPR